MGPFLNSIKINFILLQIYENIESTFFCFQIRSLKTGLNTEYLMYFLKINKVQFKNNSRNLNHVQVHLALEDFRESSIYLTWVCNFCNSVCLVSPGSPKTAKIQESFTKKTTQ